MTFETLLTLIMAASPSIVAIISIITAVVKLKKAGKISNQEVIDKFEETRKAVMDTKQFKALKIELQMAHAENRQLRNAIKELLTKVDKVVREKEIDNEK